MFNFDKNKDNIAVITEECTLSYKDLQNLCDDFISHIHSRCLIFILCSNSVPSVTGYVAAIQNRVVPLLLADDSDKTLVSNLIDKYHPDYLWLPKSRIQDFEGKALYRLDNYVLVKTPYQKEYNLFSDLALLLSTSGTTGSPKLVRLSYKNLLSNTKSICEYLEIGSDSRAITTLPMNYSFGLSIINTHLYKQGSVILNDHTVIQREFWSMLEKYEATTFSGVPYTFEILDKLRFYRKDIPKLKVITQAGGKLPATLQEKMADYCNEHNIKFYVMYGQSEATARMGYLPYKLAKEKLNYIGIAIPNGKFTLEDDEGNLITTSNTKGELIYEGDNVSLGYALKIDDLTKGDDNKGKLKTGDIAIFDEEHLFKIIGRKSRFLKIYGNRVGLDEIQTLLQEHFKTPDIACVGTDDHLVAFITKESLLQNVKDYLAEITKLNPKAFEVRFIKELPRNTSGKLQYKVLNELL